jgi:hypothetical protein
MKNFIVMGMFTMAVLSCATKENVRKDTAKPGTLTQGQTSTVCDVNGNNCTTTTTVGSTTVGVPIRATVGGYMPDSYTFLDTPDANLCIDAFTRMGVTLPIDTVARTLDSVNFRSTGVALTDIGDGPVPVLNVIHLDNNMSDVLYQLLNPVGYYCIVNNNAQYSNVSIQRSCSSHKAEIEPITKVSVNEPALCGWRFPWFRQHAPTGTTNLRSSALIELPCIP